VATELTYREALNRSIEEEMVKNPEVFIMGEDIGRYQGTFKVTRGFVEKFGSRQEQYNYRILDTPITECGFTGIGIGAAMAGLRPIVEFMTMSFSILALDQIINHAAKVHYMTNGEVKCPIVFRGPGGAAKQLSAQHSHSMDGWYAHVPGLKVVAPATAVDAYGMMKSAIADDNPVIF
jgi:pyruvate/2-oxoglutarate/acetoin dehydrogenase E1 component